jgi:hypothetical protein
MHHDKITSKVPTGNDVRVWRNGSGAVPEWVKCVMDGDVCANGTFLLKTPLGRQRVHRAYLVIEQAGEVYACAASEVEERVQELRARQAQGSNAAALIGPGKSLKSAIPTRSRRSSSKAAERRAYAAPQGVPPSIEWVGTEDLLIDESYQRSIETSSSRRLVASIAARWDWRLCMPLAVSRRGSQKYVIDGQHRHAAARKRGDIMHLPCCVAEYESPAAEAAMFVAANRCRRAINRLDDFHAALVAGDEDAIEVNNIVTSVGLRVSRNTGSGAWAPGEVAFTNSVQKVIGRHGDTLARSALSIIAVAFPGEVLTNGASIFLALAKLLAGNRGAVDHTTLQQALRHRSMKDWGDVVRLVKGGETRALAMTNAILEACETIDPNSRQLRAPLAA